MDRSQPISNPFSPPATKLGLDELKSALTEDDLATEAVCVRRTLLGREVVSAGPTPWTLEYSGLHFRQIVRVNGRTVWWCLTWVWFSRFIEFRQPLLPGAPDSHWMVEVVVGRFMRLDIFRIVIDGKEVFRE